MFLKKHFGKLILALAILLSLRFAIVFTSDALSKLLLLRAPIEYQPQNDDPEFRAFVAGMEELKANQRNDEQAIDFIIMSVDKYLIHVTDIRAKKALLNMHRIPEKFPNFCFKSGRGTYYSTLSYDGYNEISVSGSMENPPDIAIHEFAHFLDNFCHFIEFINKENPQYYDYRAHFTFAGYVINQASENLYNSDGAIFDFYFEKRRGEGFHSIFTPSYDLADMLRFLNQNKKYFLLANGRTYTIDFGHDEDYYSWDNLASEFVAAFFKLKATGQEDFLEIIKETFGEKIYNNLDIYYEEMLDCFIQEFAIDLSE